MARVIRAAAAQYPIDELTSFSAFEEKLSRWAEEAAANGAQLLVFPEYAAMELARLAGRHISRDLHGSIEALQFHIADYEAAHQVLAQRHGVIILAGSAPVKLADGRFVNRARLFTPKGGTAFQQKHIMTRSEAEEWGISPSTGLCVFDTGIAKIGIAICYDVEFPLIARALAEAGAEILLAPSCTDTVQGYHRVRYDCAARAVENQIYTIQSPTVGEAPWSAALDVNIGASVIFAPPDRKGSADGILAQGTLNAPQWVYADLDLDALSEIRKDGEVLNSRDWDLQPGAAALPRSKFLCLD
ncbi:MAG: carbon-nitrogen hydrolase family protein [Rhodomicrobium sp.]|nr:carbon-nitrogen hydrolase family protein [Rhodomicrobium sp.]